MAVRKQQRVLDTRSAKHGRAPKHPRRRGARGAKTAVPNWIWIGVGLGLLAALVIGTAIWTAKPPGGDQAGKVAQARTHNTATAPAESAAIGSVTTPQPTALTTPAPVPSAASSRAEGTAGTEDEKAHTEIRGLFDKYRRAAIACRGKEAVEYVDQNTLDYFQKMVDLARTGSAAEVHQQTFVNRIMILMCRAQYEPKELKDMTGRMLFISGVDRGQTGKQGMMNLEPGKVIIEGEVAVVQMKSQSDRSTVSMTYRRENGVWKLDMTATLKVADMAMKAAVQQQGLDEDEFLMSALESVLGHQPSEDIWEPVFPEY